MKIHVDGIQIKDGRREPDADHVRELADSIRELGLLNPITVDKEHTLIAGLHRLEAVKSLGWPEVECTVSSLEGLQAELAEIDENFVRNDLSALEYGEMLLRRKEIYEMLHPETKAGVAQAVSMNKAIGNNVADKMSVTSKSFVDDTAEKLNVDPRTVRRQIQTAKNLTPEAKEIIKGADTKITKKAALKLSRLEPEQQKEAAALLAAKEIKSVDEYTVTKREEATTKPVEQKEDEPGQEQPVEPEQEHEPHAPVPPIPYSLPEERCTSLKEVVADLKDPDKDCSCTPDIFLAEYSAFVGKFSREIKWYGDPQYEAACSALSPEQLEYLRRLTDNVCAAAESLYQQIERKVSK